MKPAVDIHEVKRLKDIKRLQILDSLPEKDFDEITKLASEICGTPVALISIIDKDRQWFKSKVGFEISETPRNLAFCNYAIEDPYNILEVPNALEDERFATNPLVYGENPVISYTGIPLISENGFALGTLCTIDHKPKSLTAEQKDSLKILASQVVRIFELRKANLELNATSKALKKRYKELEMFAGVVSHDMKSPLANITLTIDTLRKKLELYEIEDKTIETYLQYLKTSSLSLSDYIQGMLDYYKSDHTSHDEIERIKLRPLVKRIISMIDVDNSYKIKLPKKGTHIFANTQAINQILLNIITNSIKYCDKDHPEVKISFTEEKNTYTFKISDNGPGIKKEDQSKIFELFNNLNSTDRFGNRGTGIGLATVKKIVDTIEGNISIDSVVGEGTTFNITIPKPYEMIVVA
ncbi:GAF domain-containing sensor histidine kinase [Neptunitalea lumnitzerae]|uniref:histidine kinase n=1 Tax=Neptunitalea lumnitzerae TaxID=2965509 RepID=A0ABQ5MK05_9FLAO|nr:GAF domain-containing sensor histidine kinase [Neptunitalea sp. Y10]GLB49713.1 sensor histidine kinase [Neptunitalea sp. Y10]